MHGAFLEEIKDWNALFNNFGALEHLDLFQGPGVYQDHKPLTLPGGLSRLHDLKSLSLLGFSPSPANFVQLKELTVSTGCRLRFFHFKEQHKAMTSYVLLQRLTSLRLTVIGSEDLQTLKPLASLRALALAKPRGTCLGLNSSGLAAIADLRSLRSLSFCADGNMHLDSFAVLSRLRLLSSLSASRVRDFGPSSLSSLEVCPTSAHNMPRRSEMHSNPTCVTFSI